MTPELPRPRILLVTRNLPPLVGGMERLNWHMAEELAKYADVQAIAPIGAANLAPAGVSVHEVPLRPLWKFMLSGLLRTRRLARIWKPDIVLAGSGLTAPLALSAARLCMARACVYVHGLDVAIRHPIYRMFWLRAIRNMDCVVANSSPTAALCQSIGVPPARTHIVHPGVDVPPPPLDRTYLTEAPLRPAEKSPDFRASHHLGERPLLLSVGRLSTRKGLREFVTHALPLIVARQPDAMLLIVGDTPKQALHAQAQTPESILVAAEAAGVGKNIRFLGVINDYGALGMVYRAANVHVFPVRELHGDPEGFGMVAVEAAAHGLPTVAFATGGVVDAVAENLSGHLVPPGDYVALATATLQMLEARKAPCPYCIQFARRFIWPEFGKRLFASLAPFPGGKVYRPHLGPQ